MLLAMADTSGAVNRLFVSMPSVRTTIAERCGTLPVAARGVGHSFCRLGNRVEERRLSERRIDFLDFRLETLEVGREVGDLLQIGVEGEERRLVALLQRTEEVSRGLLCVDSLRPDPHASTDVKEHRHLDRPVGLGVEPDNRPPLAPSTTMKSSRERRGTKRPFLSLTTADTETRSTADLNRGACS